MIEDLKEFIEKNPNTYGRYLKKHRPDLYEWVSSHPGASVSEMCYNALRGATSVAVQCNECKKAMEPPERYFVSLKSGYRKYCSPSCSSKGSIKLHGSPLVTEEGKRKRKNALIERYGTDSMITVNREKSIATNRERYGVDFPLQSPEIRQKVIDNLVAEHGVTNVAKVPGVTEKIESTMVERYGVPRALQSVEFLEKQQKTMLDRYGVSSALMLPEIKERVKSTNIERYGVPFPMQNDEVAKLSGKRRREDMVRTGDLNSRIELYSKMFQVEAQFTPEDYIENKPLSWKHVCGRIYTSGWSNGWITICPEVDCRRQSSPQREVCEYVRSLVSDQEIRVNDRSVITPYEIDIYVPGLKFGIEVDGVYWHSDDGDKADKHRMCLDKEIRLLHITDISWRAKEDIWKSIIMSKLGLQSKVYARACTVCEIGVDLSRKFLNENHIQGYTPCSIALGLVDSGGDVVAMMTFGRPRFNKSYDWELLRFASKRCITVVGGASKLLKRGRELCQGRMVTYAKKEYSDGGLYRKLGFKLVDPGSRSYFYLGRNGETISRYQAQKHNLPKLLGDLFDPSMTEKENMGRSGYVLVSDKGSFTFGD